jgi:hypothetical protein
MSRRSTVRRVEEFVLFDVLYEDGTRTSNRKVPGSELVDIEVDLLAKTYIEAKDPQIAEISGKPRTPIKSLTRVRRRWARRGAALRAYPERLQSSASLCPRQRRQRRNPRPEEKDAA